MGNEWQNWSEMVAQAAVIIAAVGISVAAALELIKQIYKAITGNELPAELMTVGSAVVSAAIAAVIMMQSGTPWYVAVLVCLAAIWAPKLAHDGMGRLKPPRMIGAINASEKDHEQDQAGC